LVELDDISRRKLEHLEVVLTKNSSYSGHCQEYYKSIVLIHQAFPRIALDEVDLTTKFLGYELDAPIIISGMTGGHTATAELNAKLAMLASKAKIALGLGSMRAIIVSKWDHEIVRSYSIAREYLNEVPLIGNIGLNTLNDLKADDIKAIVDKLKLDALAIHLNPAQECIQPEGDTRFGSEVLDKLIEILNEIDVPIIIKEVGTGLSMETAKVFYSIGIRYFDVAGACGTNWITVEKLRKSTPEIKRRLADILSNWGIPTPISVIETRYAAPSSTIIASGGVWDGLKAVKNLALGADLVGIAKPVLEHLIQGFDRALEYIELYKLTMKTVMFLMGAKSVKHLKETPLVLLDPVKTYLEQRGINIEYYVKYVRKNI